MNFKENDIENLERKFRLNLINSLPGIKALNLLGSVDSNGNENLAVISSVVHLSSNPACVGFIMRPHQEYRRDSMNNILETKYYTLNSVQLGFEQKAHYTSAKFDSNVSEFERCKIQSLYLDDFKAPFVKDSRIKLGVEFMGLNEISEANVTMVVGKIVLIDIDDTILSQEGYINMMEAEIMGVSGLNNYYSVKKESSFPYARVEEIPDFE